LNFLTTRNLIATFFVVGSRVIERPQVLVEEYMAGHDISVHTWSHRVGISCGLLDNYSDASSVASYFLDKRTNCSRVGMDSSCDQQGARRYPYHHATPLRRYWYDHM
jgi:hypothetical protein